MNTPSEATASSVPGAVTLRPTGAGAPAIAVEICSVSVQDRADIDRMMPAVGDAVARGVAAFRPSYVLPGETGLQP